MPIDFDKAFKALAGMTTPGDGPFPWQRALYERFMSPAADNIPASCNLPTGLGKTSVIAVWLIALANGARVPRRLVYVVNRRTVVDQTTDEVMKYRANLSTAGIPEPLAISTLRGQFADNREWSADPSRPAVICGTVDMIGSRLLFSGYGCGFKTRPLHAGFLGQDALIVHDEAHLEPAFQELLLAIEKEQREGRTPDLRPLRVMELTATSRAGDTEPFGLSKEDYKNGTVDRRVNAKKALHLQPNRDPKKLAEEVAAKAKDCGDRFPGSAVIAFVRSVKDVDAVTKKLPAGSFEKLTGTLRGYERDGLVKKPIFQRFLPPSNRDAAVAPQPGVVYLVCTSAGEVGVNISADHLVCDLSTFESIAQRFGRVNRFGERKDSEIHVIHSTEFKDDEAQRLWRTLGLLELLNGDASPTALTALREKAIAEGSSAAPATSDAVQALRDYVNANQGTDPRLGGFAAPPVILPVSDILFDAWALTSVRELPGRPPVEPYLHGVEDEKQRETQVAWRGEVALFAGTVSDKQIGELLDEFPLRPHELLRDRTDRVQGELAALAKEHGELAVWVVEPDDTVRALKLADLAEENNKGYVVNLSARTVVLPPAAGGLTATGTLDGKATFDAAREYDVAGRFRPPSGVPLVRLVASVSNGEVSYKLAAPVLNLPAELTFALADGESERELFRRVFAEQTERSEVPFPAMRVAFRIDLNADADDPTDGPVAYLVLRPEAVKKKAEHPAAWPSLVGHCEGVKNQAGAICSRLDLPSEVAPAAALAGRWHDLGKDRAVWQRGAGNAPGAEPVAKTLHGRPPENLNGFRHELASLVDVTCDPAYRSTFGEQSPECRELLQHLIATHHGRGRPHFPAPEADDPERPDEAARAVVAETPQRFARLQRKYGRWGLAYLESLLRAADALDSKRIEDTPIGARVSGVWRPSPAGFAVPPAVARPEPSIRVNVDPTNPGQFFACCGLLELADRLWPGAEGWFADGQFHVVRAGKLDTLLAHLLLDGPEETVTYAEGVVATPLLAPIRLTFDGGASTGIVLDAWGKVAREKKRVEVLSNPPWNFWSGQQTSHGIWGDLREALAIQLAEKKVGFTDDLLSPTVPMTGRFGFDPGAAWNALDVGFSPDKQLMPVATSPATEMLTAVGLERFRPQLREKNESFIYATWGLPLGVAVAFAAAAGLVRVPPHLTFLGRIISRAKYSAFGFANPITGANDE